MSADTRIINFYQCSQSPICQQLQQKTVSHLSPELIEHKKDHNIMIIFQFVTRVYLKKVVLLWFQTLNVI
jgi:hypothetical protein